ncbi:branched-chain-amino-acid transaminase [Halobacillus litoralis]|uniref:branched-chain-amino-acid transaminase n=1 Tax=Halobacillus litoralis TaxID=45668 RepID=UPI001CD69DFC|nr:branched-chain-amino-acid transaminase [Halobacillus litoralis]MCA1021165.1 branched-chain-amino-acid transaminase [Halobacillus litoralis]
MAVMFDKDHFVDDRSLSVSVKNKGLNYGLGCIDGIRAFWNAGQEQLLLFRLDDHLKRFEQSGESLFIKIPYSIEELSYIIKKMLIINRVTQDVYIRPICFKDSNTLRPDLRDPFNHLAVYMDKSEYKSEPSFKVGVSSWTRIGSNMIPPQAKTTAGYMNSGLAILEESLNGYDEAVFLTKEGNVSEGATENIFIVKGNEVFTPPVSDDILPGVTRNTVAEILAEELKLPLHEKSLARFQLYDADEIFLTGTAVGIKPVVEVDRRVIGQGKPGKVTLEIQHLYNRMVRGEMPDYLHYCTSVY